MATNKNDQKAAPLRYANYRGLSHMPLRESLPDKERKCVRAFPLDSLLNTLFMPDRATGMPDASALLVIENGAVDPATREMLRRRYCAPLVDDSVGSSDPDEVLRYTKTANESFDAYIDRLTTDIQAHYRKEGD